MARPEENRARTSTCAAGLVKDVQPLAADAENGYPCKGIANDLDIDFNRFGEAQKIEKHLPRAETPAEALHGRRS
jgi:hypothetical protein